MKVFFGENPYQKFSEFAGCDPATEAVDGSGGA